MKKIFLFVFSIALVISGTGQTIQASMGPGSTSSRVKIYLKSNMAALAVNISTLQFDLAIPATVDPKPTATVVSNAFGVAWITNDNATESGYYHYFIQTSISPLVIDLTTNEFEAMEVEFSASPLNINDVTLLTLPLGGTSGKALFYFTSSNINSDGSNLYYSRPGVIATNGFSYNSDASAGNAISSVVFGTLPVKFLSFYALKSGDAAKLTWTVNDDANNEYFQVERSLDGRKYANLTRVEALANGKDINTYTATDPVLSKQGAKSLYYRIKQIDRNGGSIYSLVRILNVDNNSPLSLYPNPARTTTKLILDAPQAGKAAIILRDAAGKQVQLINMQLVKGINQRDLNVSALPSGDYNVTLVSEGLTQTIKLSKLN
jgi:hypothetical protein